MDYSQAFKFPLALEIRARFIRLLPETSADLACMRVELYGYEGVRNVPFYANYFITTFFTYIHTYIYFCFQIKKLQIEHARG